MYHKGIDTNLYHSFNMGIELFSIPYFSPELSYDLYYGTITRNTHLHLIDNATNPEGMVKISLKSNVFSISPKIIFGDNEWAFAILPKFSKGTISTTGTYFEADDLSKRFEKMATISNSKNTIFISLGIGFQAYLFENEDFSLVLSLFYNGINFNDSLKDLDFKKYGFNNLGENSQTFGIGLKLYYDLSKN